MNGSSVHSTDRLKTRSVPLLCQPLAPLIFSMAQTAKCIPVKSEKQKGEKNGKTRASEYERAEYETTPE